MWVTFRDSVGPLVPFLDTAGLHHLVTELRVNRTEFGVCGTWAGLPPELDAQREWMLYHVLDWYQFKTGNPWALLDDLPPQAPSDCSQLLAS